MNRENSNIINQFIAAIIAEDNGKRAQELAAKLDKQDLALSEALKETKKVWDFIAQPEHILGNHGTKHGEIAEQVEVGIRNAKSVLNSSIPKATFEGVGRTAPEDYLIDGVQVQAKFINNPTQNLDAIIEHLKKYPDFADEGYYQIPKNNYETIQEILKGETVTGVNGDSVLEKIREIENLSDSNFKSTVKSSLFDYEEVQTSNIKSTLKFQEEKLTQENREIKQKLNAEAAPKIGDFSKVALQGMVIGGSIRLGFKLYGKAKAGKNLFKGEFTAEDWQEIGLDVASASLLSGISATAIYGLTNFTQMSAPFAGAFVTSGIEIAHLAKDWHQGDITTDEFIESSIFVCADSAMVAAGAIIGQSFIPIPILGGLIGAISGRIVAENCRKILGKNSEIEEKIEKYQQESIDKLDKKYQATLTKILNQHQKIIHLAEAAFDPKLNLDLRLLKSIELARTCGVKESEIIHNLDELDAFMLN